MFRPVPASVYVFQLALGALMMMIAMPGCSRRPSSIEPNARAQEVGSSENAQSVPRETGTRGDGAIAGTTTSKLPSLAVDLGHGVKLEMVLIPAGDFMMGSPESDGPANSDEKPQHRVRITRPFYLGKYLVTQEQWQETMGSNPSIVHGPNKPADNVSWEDCQQFCDALNKKPHPGGKFMLPTEAQWEYACRAGSTTSFCFGNDETELKEYAWYFENSHLQSHPIGTIRPNVWGLYDMHGNVCEWCQDWYGRDYYANSPTDDPTGPAAGSERTFRGGGWDHSARSCRSVHRSYGDPGCRNYILGLRVALVPIAN